MQSLPSSLHRGAARAVLLALAFVFHAAWAQNESAPRPRVALVIGNATYPTSPLSNPINDARAMSDVLKGLGFTVIELRDASKVQMDEAITQLRDMLKGRKGVGMLYYAGHGFQLDWRNFLVPVDAKLGNARDVPRQTVDLQQVLDAFDAAGNAMSIVVLDACRDNPFGATGRGAGLAQMDARWGTFLAYATAPGNVAEDGTSEGNNSLYTKLLVSELKRPKARIEDVFKRVRLQVRQQTQGRQIPWESTSLEHDFYFDGEISLTPTADVAGSPSSLTIKQAQFDAEKADWDRVRDTTDLKGLFAFLEKYPTGFMSEQAQFRIDQLQKAAIQVQPKKDEGPMLQSGKRRYEVGDEWTYERKDRLNLKSTLVRHVVTFADDTKAVINGGEYVKDQLGGTLKDSFGEREPGAFPIPTSVAIGQKWEVASRNKSPQGTITHMFNRYHVVGKETVSVDGQQISTFKIEGTGDSVGAHGVTKVNATHWVDPGRMLPVKAEYVFYAGGKRIFDAADTYLSIKMAPRR